VFGDEGRCPTVKVCCGPRCGVEPSHRAVYAAVEAIVETPVIPTMCRGWCGQGVTVVKADGDIFKARDAAHVRAKLIRRIEAKTMASVKVLIPTPLRKLTGDQETVTLDADSVSTLMTALDAHHPGIGGRLMDEEGSLRRFVNLYVNGEDIRFLQNKETALKEGDEVSIVPAIAGGC